MHFVAKIELLKIDPRLFGPAELEEARVQILK